jgi:hypothetical protein
MPGFTVSVNPAQPCRQGIPMPGIPMPGFSAPFSSASGATNTGACTENYQLDHGFRTEKLSKITSVPGSLNVPASSPTSPVL